MLLLIKVTNNTPWIFWNPPTLQSSAIAAVCSPSTDHNLCHITHHIMSHILTETLCKQVLFTSTYAEA